MSGKEVGDPMTKQPDNLSAPGGSGTATGTAKAPQPPQAPPPPPPPKGVAGPEISPPPSRALTVVPATVELSETDVQAFSVDPATPVTWTITPPRVGEITPTGVYTAPSEKRNRSRSVIVTASTADGMQYGTATVVLSDIPWKISLVGWYGVAVAVYLGITLLLLWSLLSGPAPQRMIVVNPSVVTLDPKLEQKIQFTATVLGDSQDAVMWSVPAGQKIDSRNLHIR